MQKKKPSSNALNLFSPAQKSKNDLLLQIRNPTTKKTSQPHRLRHYRYHSLQRPRPAKPHAKCIMISTCQRACGHIASMYSLQSVLYFPVAWSFNLFTSNNLAQADRWSAYRFISFVYFCFQPSFCLLLSSVCFFLT